MLLERWIHSAYNGSEMARPTKLTPKARRRLVAAAGDGLTLRDCAALAGVTRKTLDNWIHGDDDFACEFLRARAEARLEVLRLLKNGGGGGQWRARLAWLSRTSNDYRERSFHSDMVYPSNPSDLVETMVAGLASET